MDTHRQKLLNSLPSKLSILNVLGDANQYLSEYERERGGALFLPRVYKLNALVALFSYSGTLELPLDEEADDNVYLLDLHYRGDLLGHLEDLLKDTDARLTQGAVPFSQEEQLAELLKDLSLHEETLQHLLYSLFVFIC